MNNVVGLVLCDVSCSDNFWGLVSQRSVASIPILGKYRLIDFEINHLVDNKITNVIVGSSAKFQSLMNHLGTGEYYDLARKNAGVHLLTPYNQDKWGEGNIFRSSLRILKNISADYIIITTANVINDVDYKAMLEYHKSSNSSITCLAVKGEGITFDVNQKGRVTQIGRDNVVGTTLGLAPVMIMGIEDYRNAVMALDDDNIFEFLRDNIEKQDIFYYKQKNLKFDQIDSVKKYYDYSMNAIANYDNFPVLQTRVKDMTPTHYTDTAEVVGSLVSDGSKISGSIDNCIVGSDVTIAKEALIRNSIIFSECDIASDVVLENCIVDKGAKITRGKKIIGEKGVPIVIEKQAVV